MDVDENTRQGLTWGSELGFKKREGAFITLNSGKIS